MNLTTIRKLVENDLKATDELIDNCLYSEISLIKDLGQHLIHSGGKRLRPLIVLLCAHTFSYEGDAHIKLAAVIELIHTATLLHDDVVDTSELRRGQKTANAVWGNSASVLVGDFLYSRAFQMMVEVNNSQIMQTLASATNIIAEGEILQLLNCKNPDVTEEHYLEVIRSKTGALFATSAQLGAILSERSEQTVMSMFHFGMHLGTAFQLIDDALDFSTSSDTLGKNRGDDLAEGKPTLPLLYAMKHGSSAEKASIREAIQNASADNLESILATIESTQAIAYTYQLAKEEAEKAITFLRDIPDTPYRHALIALTQFSVERTY